MGYKNDWRQIEQSVNVLKNKYNFKGLYHFTDFSNLKDIFEKGYIFSRNELVSILLMELIMKY